MVAMRAFIMPDASHRTITMVRSALTGDQTMVVVVDDSRAMTTGLIIGSIGLLACVLFALSKIGAFKRQGVWRETLRPLLICLALFGLGSAATFIIHDWHHIDRAEGNVLAVGAVLSAILLAFALRAGRRPRAPHHFW